MSGSDQEAEMVVTKHEENMQSRDCPDVQIHSAGDGRPNSQADDVSGSAQEAEMVVIKHEQNMQSRDMERHVIRMRGLPFKVTEGEISEVIFMDIMIIQMN